MAATHSPSSPLTDQAPSVVGNCSPARHARFRQPAIAGWRIKNSKKGWRKGGEVGRGLSKFQKIIDTYGRIKYHLPFSKVASFNSRPKQGRIPQIPYENQLLFLIWTFRSVDPMIPIEFFSQQYTYADPKLKKRLSKLKKKLIGFHFVAKQ